MRNSAIRLRGNAALALLLLTVAMVCTSGEVRANADPVLGQLPAYPATLAGLTSDFDPEFGFRSFDDFEFDADTRVDSLSFQGMNYDFATAANNPVPLDASAYFVEIYEDVAGEPGNRLLILSFLPQEVKRTFVGLSAEGYAIHDFSVSFPGGLNFPADTRYWLAITTNSPNGNPIFVWLSGLGGNGVCYQDEFVFGADPTFARFERPLDLAFTFSQQPEYLQPPEPASSELTAWATDVDAAVGFRTYDDFIANETMTIESVVFQGLVWDFENSANNPVGPDTYAWDIAFYSSTFANGFYQPAAALREEVHAAADVQTRFLGTRFFALGNVFVPVYEITIVLNEPFVAEPDAGGSPRRYWVSPRSRSATYSPSFGWVSGTGGDGLCVQDEDNLTTGPGQRFSRGPDRAFDLCELQPPTAVAGESFVTNSIEPRDLDGSASYDDTTAPINLLYQWTLEDRPGGSLGILSNDETSIATFIPDVPGDYRFELVVTDKDGLESEPASITVTYNQLPIADAGDSRVAIAGDQVVLDGSQSMDPDGTSASLQWNWTIIAGPPGSAASLVDPTSEFPGLDTDVSGSYIVQLVVNDGLSDSYPDLVEITAVSPTDYAAVMIEQASSIVDALPRSAFRSPAAAAQTARPLMIAARLQERGLPRASRALLQVALSQTDGCALRGAPDRGRRSGGRRDSVTDCDAQLALYAAITEAIRGLQ